MPELTLTDTQRRKHAAYWFAVGAQAVTDGPEVADHFAVFHELEAAAYHAGRASFLSSVPDAWRRFASALEDLERFDAAGRTELAELYGARLDAEDADPISRAAVGA